MKPVLNFLLGLAVVTTAFSLCVRSASAVDYEMTYLDDSGNNLDIDTPDENTAKIQITFTGLVDDEDVKYGFCLSNDGCPRIGSIVNLDPVNLTATDNRLSIAVCGAGDDAVKTDCDEEDYFHTKEYAVGLYEMEDFNHLLTVNFRPTHFFPDVSPQPDKPTPDTDIRVIISGERRPFSGNNRDDRNDYDLEIKGVSGTATPNDNKKDNVTVPSGGGPVEANFGKLPTGQYVITIKDRGGDFIYYSLNLTVKEASDGGGGSWEVTEDPRNAEQPATDYGDDCPDGPNCNRIVDTVFGPISSDAAAFATKFLNIAIGIAGGVAFLLMVFGSYRLIFGGGNPEAIEQGKQVITAAIVGLLVIVFSVFILNLIGISILGLKIGL